MGLSLRDQHIAHPFRPALKVDRDNIDQLVELLQVVKNEIESLRSCEYSIRSALGAIAQGDRKTQRLRGEKHKVKITWPDDTWQQTALKELWQEDPQQSQVYLRIATLAPNLREVKKMEETYGNERFEAYKAKLLGARQPATSPPSVTVELD